VTTKSANGTTTSATGKATLVPIQNALNHELRNVADHPTFTRVMTKDITNPITTAIMATKKASTVWNYVHLTTPQLFGQLFVTHVAILLLRP
jgi:erythromycin esterase-like protein